MKFGPKIFLVLAGLILTLVGLTSVFATQVVRSAYLPVSLRAINSAASVILGTLSDRAHRSRLLLAPLTNDARIKGGLSARAGLADPEQLGGQTPAERRQNADDYFGSFIDEYWVEDSDGRPEQDLLLLVGKDGTLAYGESGGQERVEGEVLEHLQVSTLIGAIASGNEAAVMLWSGPRLRSDPPKVPGLEQGLYYAAGRRIAFHGSGIGGDEVIGLAVIASSRVGLDRVPSTGAEAVFVDRGAAIESTFRLPRASGAAEPASVLEQAATAWLATNPEATLAATPVVLGGVPYYARVLTMEGMVRGPVKAGIFYSRAEEFGRVSTARTQLIVVGIAVGLLAVVIAVGLSRSLSRPIGQLSAAAGRVAEGDLKVSVPAERRDELGDLARRFNAMVQGLRERALAKDALGRYLSPEMAHDVVSGAGGLSLEGQRRELTILFCDVAGFTTISEQLEPEALVGLLNQYLDAMVKVLIRHGAYVDKFEGDAIMAFWNAPRLAADHAVQACHAILEMRAGARQLSAEWKAAGQPGFAVRYGLNTGIAIVGNMGATDKINYTAIGDHVNLASRLEGANKQYGTELMISEQTFELAAGQIEARELDLLKVKGKQRGVRVYELLARKGELPAEQAAIRDGFAAGLSLYRERRFDEARARFDASPADGPSRVFAARCRHFLQQPPPPDWDGIYEMETK